MVYSLGFAPVAEDVDFQLCNVPYSPSTRKDPVTFKNNKPIGKVQCIDSIR